jgi:antitoxin component of MazEF toxin-antitoxin module
MTFLSWKRWLYRKGNSLAVTIPAKIVESLGLKDKEQLEYVYLGKGRWEIRSTTGVVESEDSE